MRGWLLSVGLCAGLAPALARAQEPAAGADDRPVDELAARAAQAFATDPSAAWRLAYELATLGPPALPRLRALAEGADAVKSLVALRALAELGEAGVAAGRACDWAAAGSLATRVAAAELAAALAARHQGPAGEPVRRALRERLPALLDDTFEPRVKVPLAMALWHAAADRRAVRELKSLLASEDPEVTVAAALGLGETGDVQAARAHLQRLRHEPTPRGRLARAVLERETLQRLLMMQAPGGRPLRIGGEGLELLEELRAKIESHYPEARDADDLIRAAARGIAASLDPAAEFLEDAGIAAGDGLHGPGFRLAMKEGLPVVLGLARDAEAARLGVANGDRVLKIGGELVFGKPLAELTARLRGPPGSTVTIETWRDQRPRWVRWHPHTLPRLPETAPAAVAERLPGGLGVLRIDALGPATATEVRDGLAALRAGPLAALVVDLRGCAAGSRDALLAVAAELLGPGRLVYASRGKSPRLAPPSEFRTPDGPGEAVGAGLPSAVLVGPGTGGPGELLAAALRAHHTSELVGSHSFGNGQEVYSFPLTTAEGKAWLRLPIAVYRTAEGAEFHGTGLAPDVRAVSAPDPGWVETERDKVRASGAAEREAARLLATLDPAAVRTLAESDGGDWHAYPGFAEWHAGLGTRAEPAQLRGLLRDALRRALGAQGITRADPREDPVLARAALRLLARIGVEPAQHPLYAGLAAG